MNISQNDFESWKAIPATQEFFKDVAKTKEEAEERLGRGQALNMSSAEETLAMTAKLVGFINGLNQVLNIYPNVADIESE